MVRRLMGVLSAGVLLVGAFVAPAPGAQASTYSKRLRTAVSELPVAAENNGGYDRDKFPHWIDADGDGCDTREEVLLAEAQVKPSVGAGCRLTGGRWYSWYDRRTWTDKGRIDIDHVVPLAEAWGSGGRAWTTAQRRAFANDLGDGRSLVGVTDTVNQAKGDKDPAQWMPRYGACKYVRFWVAVKIRWRLKVDRAEKNTLTEIAAGCENVYITVERAIATSSPTTTTRPGTCDSSYPGVCIPSPPPDLDCSEISYRNFTVVGDDPHNFDTDNDGVGCES